MACRATHIDQSGYARPSALPDDFRGSPEHARASMLGKAYFRDRWRRQRNRYFDRYRFRKIAWIVTRRGALRRLLNFAIYLVECGRVARVHYKPVVANIEPGNSCNLSCPGCVTGGRNPQVRKRRRTTFEDMKQRIDRFAPWALQLQLYHWGEPFLNPDVLKACSHATQKGIWTTIHSNLSLHIDSRRIVESGLCNLVVSVDGASQKVYEQYRVKGDLELVLSNIRAIADEKRRSKRGLPWISAKFLVFDHNWHEATEFEHLAFGAGADEVLFVGGLMDVIHQTDRVAAEREFDLTELRYVERRLEPGCRELWETISMDSDGGVFPCCDSFRDKDLFATDATARGMSTGDLWNDEKWLRARTFFTKEASHLPADLPSPCNTCERVLRHARARSVLSK